MTSFSLVDVKNITSDIPRSSFSETDLERLAELIIAGEGLIKPLVLKVTEPEIYQVVDGHFEYYAAVKAREKDPRKGEMVNAFIISPKSENVVLQQAEAIKRVEFTEKQVEETSSQTNLEQYLRNIELRLNDLSLEQLTIRRNLEDKLENKTQKQMPPLETFNTLSIPELVLRLRSGGLNDKKAIQVAEIVESERKKQKFDSLNNVVARVKITKGKRKEKGISAEKMVDLVEIWSRLSFS